MLISDCVGSQCLSLCGLTCRLGGREGGREGGASEDVGTDCPSGRSYATFCHTLWHFNRTINMSEETLRETYSQFLSRQHTHRIARKSAEYELTGWLYDYAPHA